MCLFVFLSIEALAFIERHDGMDKKRITVNYLCI